MSSKVHLKYFKLILEENQKLQQEVSLLKVVVSNLTTVYTQQRPLSKAEVFELITKLSEHPKQLEQQAVKLLNQVGHKVEQIEIILSQIGVYFNKRSIINWYENSRTANIDYLDLASTSKVSTKEIAHNLSVIYDRIYLSSKVHLKYFKLILEENQKLQQEVSLLKVAVSNLTTVYTQQRPLSKAEVFELITKLSEHPKQLEQQAVKLLNQVGHKVEQIETILSQIGVYFNK